MMTAICVRAPTHRQGAEDLMAIQLVPLLVFIAVAIQGLRRGCPGSSIHELSWFNPFEIGSGGPHGGTLLSVFIYWGWESAVSLNEETDGDVTKPGLAG
jgi:hypothetical protein